MGNFSDEIGNFEWHSSAVARNVDDQNRPVDTPMGLPDFVGSNAGVSAVIIPLGAILKDGSLTLERRKEIARSLLATRLMFGCLIENLRVTDLEQGTFVEFHILTPEGGRRAFRFGF